MNYNIVEEKFLFRAFNSYFLEADHNVNKRKRVSGILGSFDGLTFLHFYTFWIMFFKKLSWIKLRDRSIDLALKWMKGIVPSSQKLLWNHSLKRNGNIKSTHIILRKCTSTFVRNAFI